jgi:oligopeptide/dipeptide ABC transporter ATP-binding protein
MTRNLVSIRDLTVSFPVGGKRAAVLDRVSLEVPTGKVLALVGESGCGKSTMALALMRLIPKPGLISEQSVIEFESRNLLTLPVPEMRNVRGSDIAMIFQDPMTSLNPVQRVGDQLIEAIRLHESISAGAARDRVIELFERVGIPDAKQRFATYPHLLSGGLKQRVMIAMALAMRPKLLIADEPTTALDVTIQAQILALLRELQRDFGTTIVLITHDLGVVNELADRVAVMYAGRVVEEGERLSVLSAAQHPYTQGLLRSIPRQSARGGRLAEISGVVPAAGEWAPGCRFAGRCDQQFAPCQDKVPAMVEIDAGHAAWCHALAGAEEA